MALKGDGLAWDVQGLNRTFLSRSERDGALGTTEDDITVELMDFLE